MNQKIQNANGNNRSPILWIRWAVWLLAGFLFLACSSVDLSKYSAESRGIYIHNFTNDSFQADIPVEVKRAMQNEILRRRNFIVQSDKSAANLRLYGRVTGFRRRGLMYDDLRNPTRIELILICRMKLRRGNPGEGELLASREISAAVSFQATENEKQARLRLARNLAIRMHSILEKEFINNQPVMP